MSEIKNKPQEPNGTDVIYGIKQRYYHCPKCKGYTYDVDYCANPDCPNMPCCGLPRELCKCNTKS